MRLENYSEDYLYRKLDRIPEDIKIIAIDDKTLEELGPYSDWNRSYFADLIELLNEDEKSRPQIIGVNIIFSGTNDSEEDQALADAAAKAGNIVFASSLESETHLMTDDGVNFFTKTIISNEYKPYDALAEVSEYGFTNVISDDDGIVRQCYTTIPPDHQSFSFLIASKLADVPEYHGKEEIVYSTRPGEIEAVSMSRVLDGTVPASQFAGSVVLIGAYAGGMLNSYKVPCDYSREMFGVEMQANYITAFLHDRIVREIPKGLLFSIVILISTLFGTLMIKNPIRRNAVFFVGFSLGYLLIAYLLFQCFLIKLPLVTPLGGFGIFFILSLFYQYVQLLKRRQRETQTMLFSMAEGFAEAIEGRTPYNANHTKNVARRCIEMVDYINELHKENKTQYHFSEADKRQLYLAAMLHDIGKMDVPLEIMDKPTKLGSKETKLKDRLTIIMLNLKNDILTGQKNKDTAEQEIRKINTFLENIDAFNCGRPLKDEEWEIISSMEKGSYENPDGSRIPYLTEEEIEDLHIKAGTLSDSERTVMQSHVVYTDKILSHMTFGEEYKDVRQTAANHHELLNGKGYPKQLKAEEIDIKTRILTIMDIYDSLIADDRPYKKPKSIAVAFDILTEEAEAGKVDPQLLEYAKDLYLKEH